MVYLNLGKKNYELKAGSGKMNWNKITDRTVLSLLGSNLITVVFALLENWDIITLMWIYWAQSVIIGIFNFFQILSLEKFSTDGFTVNDREVDPTSKTKYSTAFFFLFHYGFFHFVYAIFLLVFPAILETKINWDSVLLNFGLVLLTIGIFFINQIFTFVENRRNFREDLNIGHLMMYPYARIIPMHLTIIFGFFIAFTMGGFANKLILILFLGLKTIADIIMQTYEVSKLRKIT